MLGYIDNIFNNKFEICNIAIYRMRNLKGNEIKDGEGKFPFISNKKINCKDSPSTYWLMAKHAQMQKTDFNDLESVKRLFAGMNTTKVSEFSYNEKRGTYIQKFLTYTVGQNKNHTKEYVILELKPKEVFGTKEMNIKTDTVTIIDHTDGDKQYQVSKEIHNNKQEQFNIAI